MVKIAPLLSQLASQVLTMPAASAPLNRVLSAGLTITKMQSRLDPANAYD